MREIDDTAEILGFLGRDPYLHLYEIGDLDDFFRLNTRWYAEDEVVFLVYDPGDLPVLLALEGERKAVAADLLAELLPRLPSRFYCHSTPYLSSIVSKIRKGEPHGRHLKMALKTRSFAEPDRDLRPLGPGELAMIQGFYAAAYPGNWFDPRMLETGQFVGGFEGGELVAVAGIHVYSPKFKVAALGNIAVAPAHRSRGWGRAVTEFLCRRLEGLEYIGLNVHAENEAAIRCYRSIGFEPHAEYDEFMVGP